VDLSNVRLLRAAERAAMPWKNGGGITFEVASFPEGSTLDNFGWRISVADLREDGPFSIFPGVNRQLAVLDGELSLSVAGNSFAKLSRESLPFEFPGDVAATARLATASARDLNVMTRRGQFTSRMSRAIARNRSIAIPAAAALVVVALDPMPAKLSVQTYELQPFDALLWTSHDLDPPLLLGAGTDFREFIQIEIYRV